jgi:hypothetical protein
MRLAILYAAGLAALSLGACSKSDTSPTPAHNAVTAAMPDAGSTPGAQGPGATAPHAAPPETPTLSDTHPQPGGQPPPPAGPDRPSPTANPADHPN